jgi:UDP-N-acetylmuramoyl-tripeptide--D-alanyl-D-alanine ligase
MNLQLDEIAKAAGGSLEGPGNVKVRGYSIDTRTLNPGDLFFAVKGPRFDGHAFVQQAMEKKAAGIVVESGAAEPSASFSVIRVGSTVDALQDTARTVRRRWGQPIVGVTGSAGKTTTKEMIAAVLGKKFTVLRSIGNLNNEFGLPLCLLRVERYQTIGVLEMGMSAKGEIRKLASIAEPNEGVITNVNPVHLEFFDSIEGIAEAKAELLEGLMEPRLAYLNNDDSRVRAMARKFTGKIVTYGVKSVQGSAGAGSRPRGNCVHGTPRQARRELRAAAAGNPQRFECAGGDCSRRFARRAVGGDPNGDRRNEAREDARPGHQVPRRVRRHRRFL